MNGSERVSVGRVSEWAEEGECVGGRERVSKSEARKKGTAELSTTSAQLVNSLGKGKIIICNKKVIYYDVCDCIKSVTTYSIISVYAVVVYLYRPMNNNFKTKNYNFVSLICFPNNTIIRTDSNFLDHWHSYGPQRTLLIKETMHKQLSNATPSPVIWRY